MEGPGPKVFLTKALGQEKATERDVFNLTMPSSTSAKAGASGSASTPGAGPEASWTHLTRSLFTAAPGGGNTGPRPDPVKTSLGLWARGELSPQAFRLRRGAGRSSSYG